MSKSGFDISRPLGHEELLSRLEAAAASAGNPEANRLHHAYLMAGPAGVGKFHSAIWWSALLKCSGHGDCAPKCRSCRLLAAGVHPDVTLVAAPQGKKSIGVDAARALIGNMALKPLHPGPRIAVLRGAERLTPEAQNALLKLLEEPPGFAVIILVADNASALLATVRSRCHMLRFGVLSRDVVSAVLRRQGRDAVEAEAAAAVSRGSVARAMVYDTDGLADREELLGAFERLRKGDAALEAVLGEFIGRKAQGYGLGELYDWQLEKIEAALGAPREEASTALRSVVAGLTPRDADKLIADAARIDWTIAAIERNVGAKIAIRDLLLNMKD